MICLSVCSVFALFFEAAEAAGLPYALAFINMLISAEVVIISAFALITGVVRRGGVGGGFA